MVPKTIYVGCCHCLWLPSRTEKTITEEPQLQRQDSEKLSWMELTLTPPQELPLTASEGAVQATKGEKSTTLPSSNPINHKKTVPAGHPQRSNSGTLILGITKSCLIGLRVHSIKGDS